MDSFQLIGLIIIGGLIFYLVNYFSTHKNMESFTNLTGTQAKISSDGLGNAASQQNDSVLVAKYRSDYESLVTNLQKYIGDNIIQLMLQLDSSQVTINDANLAIFKNINTLQLSYDNMEKILTYIQAVPSSS